MRHRDVDHGSTLGIRTHMNSTSNVMFGIPAGHDHSSGFAGAIFECVHIRVNHTRRRR